MLATFLYCVMSLTKEVPDFEYGLVSKYTSIMVVIIPNVIFFSPFIWGTRWEEWIAAFHPIALVRQNRE